MKCWSRDFIVPILMVLSYTKGSNHCSSGYSHDLTVSSSFGVLNMSSQGYAPDSTCEWLLVAPPGGIIKVTIIRLDTECSWDRLYLYDGKSFRDKLLGVYSGGLLPRPVYATSGAMLVYFFSDYDGTATGFNLQYSLVGVTSDGVTPLGSIGSCTSDSQCQTYGGSDNVCDRETSRCVCGFGYSGVYCTSQPRSWRLMNVGEPAVTRAGHRITYLSGTLYLYGGYDYSSTTPPTQLYSSTDMVNFKALLTEPTPASRYSHQMAVQKADLPLFLDYGIATSSESFGEDALFVHGGTLFDGTITDELWTYHIHSNTWSKLTSSPLAVADHVMVVIDNRWLFTHGGRTDMFEDNPIGDMYIYDTKERTWSKVQYQHGYEPSLRLAGHTAVHSNYMLYIYGGYTQNNARFLRVQDLLWKYNVKERIWSKILPPASGLGRYGLAFHAAAIYEHRMYIYGGKTLSRTNCINQHVYVFDTLCQEWLRTSASNTSGIYRSLGQYGHDMIVIDYGGLERLYIYGGVQGSLTADTIAIEITSLQAQSVTADCNLCLSQTTCASCALAGCRWCAAERSCVHGRSVCDDIYWGDNHPIHNVTSCVTEDKPAGWYYSVYKYPVNYSQPDEVELSTSSSITWYLSERDYECIDCPSELIARGYLYEMPEEPPNELRFTSRRNMASLYSVTTGGNEQLIDELPVSLAPSTKTITRSRVPFGDNSGYIQYKALQYPVESEKSSALVGLLGHFFVSSGFTLPYLKPYSAGSCSSYTNCLLCAADSLCGWCASQSQCLLRTSASCNGGSDWLLTDPAYCANCTVYTSCLTCTESEANCEWLTDIHRCVRRGRRALSVRSPQSCHQPCLQRGNCRDCLETVNECIWCTTLNTCLPMDSYQLDYQYGECLHFQSSVAQATPSPSHSNKDVCVECSEYTTCKECSEGLFCGWCSHNADPIIGVCVSGDFSAPHNGQQCPAVIQSTHDTLGEATWSFRRCPDLLECKLGRHDCVENAECNETLQSYECHCARGYTGVGNVSCVETCYYECINGGCISTNQSGKIEFGCACNLGWTGESCDIDCICNYHSTCIVGPGLCDKCHNFTTGDRCERCVADSYGDPSEPAGCSLCQCNGHGDPAGQCDSVTGTCNCIHNTMGRDCSQCAAGYFGDPRLGRECFRCYHGRTLITNIDGADNYGTQYCHRGIEFFGTSVFLWTFRGDNSQGNNKSLLFVLSTLGVDNTTPVYVYDYEPSSLLDDNGALATLTKKDVGMAVTSSTGVLSVVYYAEESSEDAMLRFKVMERGCPDNCPDNTSQCTQDGRCECVPGHIGADCQTDLECSSVNKSYCGIVTRYMPARTKAATSENSKAMYIHGGVTADGRLLNDLLVVNKSSLSLTSPAVSGVVPSARYGHALECTVTSCFLYGGITADSAGSLRLHQYKDASGSSLSISSQFFQLTLNISTLQWSLIENKVVPPLSGHTMTSIALSNGAQHALVLIGGMTEELIWNTNVYLYNNSKWSLLTTSGARPRGLVGHSVAYRPAVNALYIVPGHEPLDSKSTEETFYYILDMRRSVWTKRQFLQGPRSAHYAFSLSDRYLAIIGGYYSSTDSVSKNAVDSRSTFSVYDTSCGSWHNWWSPTSITGSIDRENIIGYGFISPTTSMNKGVILIVSSDQKDTLLSSISIRLDLCSEHSNGSVKAVDGFCIDGQPVPRCSKDPRSCSSTDNCDDCTSALPDYYNKSSACVWSPSEGSCTRSDSLDGIEVCPSDVCRIHTSCLSCTRTPSCRWMSDTDRMQYASCASSSSKLQYISSPDSCPIMASTLTCQSCLSKERGLSHSTYTHSSASYLWNLSQQYCMVTDVAAILSVSHIGIVATSSGSCPKDCSEYRQCITCQSQPHCGWCSVAESSLGTGLCMEGTRNNSSQCVVETLRHGLEMEVVEAKWNYATCPEENECINGHHTCDIKVQKCVDKLIGFECECRDGYDLLTELSEAEGRQLCSSLRSLPATDAENSVLCVPVCPAGCGEHGCCIDADTCECNLGHVGKQCEKKCNCNGHSSCPENDLSTCLNCVHNTTGASCENCLQGFVGNPTSGEDCVSCYHTCNQRSDTCENSRATGPRRSESITRSEVNCVNCTDNSEGNLCEHCEQGHFSHTNNTCVPCICNGHGENGTCYTETGANCVCRNNTVSSFHKYNTQCDSCVRDYTGTPTNNHQCYRIVNAQNLMCFDNRSSTACSGLTHGQAAYYALNPVTGHSSDVKLVLELTEGAADIYISESASTFIVTYDPLLNEHVITFDQSKESTDQNTQTKYRRKRSNNGDEEAVVIPRNVDLTETDTKGQFAVYHSFDTSGDTDEPELGPSMVLKLMNVKYRAIVVFPQSIPSQERYFIIVKSQHAFTKGSLKFAQYNTKIEIFVFINVFSSMLLLFLCSTAIVWKMRQLQLIRQLQAVREVQLHAMADRPFSTTMMCMDVEDYYHGACNVPFNVVPLALEPIRNSSAVVATTFILLPGDESRPMKAAMASTLLTWRLSFPPATKSKVRTRADDAEVEETAL